MRTQPLFDEQPYERSFDSRVLAIEGDEIALEHSAFYPVGGGQPGDTGTLTAGQDIQPLMVSETRRDRENPALVYHRVDSIPSSLQPGSDVTGSIDWQRRYRHMRMHTCLHLLCSLIDAPVTGCGIAEEKGRLDFDLPESTLDKVEITERLNALIAHAVPVSSYSLREDQYGDVLAATRTRSVKPPIMDGGVRMVRIEDVDTQPCGGTHVANTSEIGQVVCAKIEKKSAHNRRVTIRFVS